MSRRKDKKNSGSRPVPKVTGKTYSDDLKRALDWVLMGGVVDSVKLHGNVTWLPIDMVRLAICWVWSSQSTLVGAATEAIEFVTKVFLGSPVSTYQGLTNALKRYTPDLISLLWKRLHDLMKECGGDRYRIGLWLVLAMDGSRVDVPRTKSNEERFCKPRGTKKKSKKNKRSRHANRRRAQAVRKKSHYDPQPVGPQMWLTLLWHVGLQNPWAWKIGPSYSSERNHMLELLASQKFPEKTLFCGDAGFVGYEFWQQIRTHGHHFIVRVGGNVRLLKKLGYVRERDGIVYCWPDKVAQKKQPPLALRLMRFHDGRGEVYLLTSVLNASDLPDKLASEIYRRRWGVELQFRSLKQTFDRTKLRSRTPDCAEIELHWSLLGLWMIQLLAVKERTQWGDADAKTSVAAAIRIIQRMMTRAGETRSAAQSLSRQLADATTDTYRRTSRKRSRNYPRRKEEPSTKKPIIKVATAQQRRKAKQVSDLQTAT